MTPFFTILGASAFYVTLWMTFLFVIAAWKNNTSFVDLGWALSFSIIAILGLFLGEGDASKRIVLSLMMLSWSLRLGWHLWLRLDWDVDDPRYIKILNNIGSNHHSLKIFLMFMLQTFLILILALPFYLIFSLSQSGWNVLEILSIPIFIIGLIGIAKADYDLVCFKLSPENSSKVCQVGLWRYSRHPNYFFEWVIWISFFLFAVTGPGGYWSILSPLIMFILLTKISGIPQAEAQCLKTKGDLYKNYMMTTSAFFPWFAK